METMMPTSFIPKRPVSSEPLSPQNKNQAIGLLTILARVIVFATIISYGGIFFYQKQLLIQKAKTDQLISDARKGIGTEFLGDMQRLDARIEGVKTSIAKHVVITPIFAALEQTTLRSIQYTNFGYVFTTDPSTQATMVEVTVTGTAKSYSTIALQSDAFSQNTLIQNPIFSSLIVDDKTSAVNFKLVFSVDPKMLSYETFIAGIAAGANIEPVTTTPITSTIQ